MRSPADCLSIAAYAKALVLYLAENLRYKMFSNCRRHWSVTAKPFGHVTGQLAARSGEFVIWHFMNAVEVRGKNRESFFAVLDSNNQSEVIFVVSRGSGPELEHLLLVDALYHLLDSTFNGVKGPVRKPQDSIADSLRR